MPNRPARPCKVPGCPLLQPCPTHLKINSSTFQRDPARQRLYGRTWQKRRAAQLASHPWCEDCLELQPPVHTPATEVHHEERHEGDQVKFVRSPLRSLCKAHHSKRTQAEVRQKRAVLR